MDSHYRGPPPYDEDNKTEISDSAVNRSEIDEDTDSSDTDNKGDGDVKVQSTRWFGGETSGVEWGKIEFSDDTPLYCDWGFLTRKEGGLNSLGAGALGFSLSAGWDTPLWAEFQNKIDESKTPVHSISDEQEVTVVGHTQFISLGGEVLSMSMEGKDWFAAIITPSPIKQIDQLSEYDWAIVFFKSDCFMFPKNLWDQIEDQIDVYGDVVSTNFSTPIGEAECFVKARACAYIDDR